MPYKNLKPKTAMTIKITKTLADLNKEKAEKEAEARRAPRGGQTY